MAKTPKKRPKSRGRPRSRKKAGKRVKLRAADAFQLIRWLARSQSDPRKAVAELVQNSLDANAKHITIERRRIRRIPRLIVRDDGEGVLPDQGREDALNHIATHIGESHKLKLSVAERHERVVAGRYGVGLLGFWAVGKMMELRSRVAGSRVYVLRLEEESANATIEPVPSRVDEPPGSTEVTISAVHPTAMRALSGKRLADYLAGELRGQLLRRKVELTIHDHVARGTAQKTFHVVPRQIMGDRLPVPERWPVEGHSCISVELYAIRGSERDPIQVGCAGTLVADDMVELLHLGIDEDPWAAGQVTGIIDFPDFNVPPGTRRGVAPDARAEAFVSALARLRPLVMAEIAKREDERTRFSARDAVRELRRALRGFHKRLPQYELPSVAGPEGSTQGGTTPRSGPGAELAEAGAPNDPPLVDSDGGPGQLEILAPGPLATARIVPETIEIAPGGEHRAAADLRDEDGRRVSEADLEWSISESRDGMLEVRDGGRRPAIAAHPTARVGLASQLQLLARQGRRRARAKAEVRVIEPPVGSGFGIPEPTLIDDPDGLWRGRMDGNQWEVNAGHEDYVALAGATHARIRYLLMLLTREIVLRSTGRPDAAEILDAAVDILAHAERNLKGKG